MFIHLRPALVLLGLFTGGLGIAYPALVTVIAEAAMPRQAGGSLVETNGAVIGSLLIGQPFTSDRYFKGRPSATSAPDPGDASKTVDAPYNASSSGGSNLGPTSQKLVDRVATDVKVMKGLSDIASVPADSVTTSASGLDPHISPENASVQVVAVSRARGLSEARVRELVRSQTEGRWLGFIGEPRLNVLALNLALDALKP